MCSSVTDTGFFAYLLSSSIWPKWSQNCEKKLQRLHRKVFNAETFENTETHTAERIPEFL